MLYLLLISTVILMLFLLGNLSQGLSFRNKVKQLYKKNEKSEKYVDADSYTNLPAPVQRYFIKTIKEGLPYIHSARMKHTGFFRTNLNKGWKAIKGEQYFTALSPGFIWRGKTSLFTATDSFIRHKGSLKVWLFSCVRIMSRSGAGIDEGELLRWLAETVWFPTSLLPNKYITWEPLNDSCAKLILNYKSKIVSCTVHFNEHDEIYKIESTRFFEKNRKEKWVGQLGRYEYHNNFYIPTRVEAAWILDGTKRSYALFEITSIDYNLPLRFKD